MPQATSHFDQAAQNWDKKQRRVELARAISDAIATLPLDQDMKALEYGCGTGLVGLALAPQLGRLTAADTSQGMLNRLQEKIAQDGADNVTPLLMDLSQAPCAERFDLIFCAMTLHHIQEAEQVVARMAGMLNPGGWLAIADLEAEDGSFHSPEASGVHHHGFDSTKLSGSLTDLGLAQVQAREVHRINKDERDYPVFLVQGQRPPV